MWPPGDRPERAAPTTGGAATAWIEGNDRVALGHLALRFARILRHPYFWLEVLDPDEPRSAAEQELTAEVPPERLLEVARPADLAPDDPGANLAIWAGSRGRPAGEDPEYLDFLRLPGLLRSRLEALLPSEAWMTLVVANAERLHPHYPDELGATRRWLSVLAANRVGVIVTYAGSGRGDRFAFDDVVRFEDRGEAEEGWFVRVERNSSRFWDVPVGRSSVRVPDRSSAPGPGRR